MNGALAGMVILVLGDSHMAGPSYLISSLHEALEAQGAQVDSYGMCGASPDAWLERTTVSCGTAERHGANATQATNGKQQNTWQINDLLNDIPQSGGCRGGRRDGRVRLAAVAESVDL